jgi:hypothetical protein
MSTATRANSFSLRAKRRVGKQNAAARLDSILAVKAPQVFLIYSRESGGEGLGDTSAPKQTEKSLAG